MTAFASCPHVRDGTLPAITRTTMRTIQGAPTRADLNTETELCGACSGVLVAIMLRLERGTAKPEITE